MEATPRLAMPLLAPGQAQKEMTHNEALALLDLAVTPAVEAAGLDVPPAAPLPGQGWIVGSAPVDAWAGHAHALAGWTTGGWRFVAAPEGASAWNKAASVSLRRTSLGWSDGALQATAVAIGGVQVVGGRQPAIGSPAGGNMVDAEARAAIAAMLEAMRVHGLVAR